MSRPTGLAGRLARLQRRQDADGEIEPGADVGDGERDTVPAGRPWGPVTDIRPDIAWTIRSKPPRPA